jgi:hypothetical protein
MDQTYVIRKIETNEFVMGVEMSRPLNIMAFGKPCKYRRPKEFVSISDARRFLGIFVKLPDTMDNYIVEEYGGAENELVG